ncbi:MAG TPA: glycosyltransferase family 2 protein [Gemmatimonadaceae bacterium]|nr:glycosyltransferase family 2 protein [Gemmatimonadaceae bacterium]
MIPRQRRSIVLLGMMTKMPVPGVIWQTLHYLLGFRRLGYDVIYVEAHARAPAPFMDTPTDPGTARAAEFLRDLMSRYDLADRWAYHALHESGGCFGMGLAELRRAYESASAIVNLHGGTAPLDEHVATGRLILVATDPGLLEVELWTGRPETLRFLDAHCAAFTFGENYGRPVSGLPFSDRFSLLPTRQPVVPELWETVAPAGSHYRTVANWRQRGREFGFGGEWYEWSKDLEFAKILDVPRRSGLGFELALSNTLQNDAAMLESRGWLVRDAGAFGLSTDPYRRFIQESRGELTAAKDQNVRLRTGWFSDRSATFLAAGRPVVTQDTGFGESLPTGRGLFAFTDLESALAALETIESDHDAACRAASDVAREYFDYRVVLTRLLADAGIEGPRAQSVPRASVHPLDHDLRLEPVSRRPLRLSDETVRALLARPLPGSVAERPPLRSPLHPTADRPCASVIVVTWENLALTRLCLESLLAHTPDVPFELIIVDNASADGTRAYLQALAAAEPRARLILNERNDGFARACNQGARAAAGDILVFLNNDTVLSPGWLRGLFAHLERPGVGAVSAVTNRIGTEAEVSERARTLGEFLERAAHRRSAHAGESRTVEMLAFFCVALRRDAWTRVGLLDEAFGRGLFEDDDYSARLHAAGYRLVCAEDVLVHHLGEASFGRLVTDGTYRSLFDENRRRFESKWGREWRRPSRSTGGDDRYRMLIERIRSSVSECIPTGTTIAVVSRGDDALLDLGATTAWHFPLAADGRWAGHYPADSAAAVEQVEAVRLAGAEYLLLPEPAFWWLDHYSGLGDHLLRHGEEVARTPDLRLYRLVDSPGPVGDPAHVATSMEGMT